MGTKRVGMARIRSLINENTNDLRLRNREVVTISEDTTLTAADSGKLILCNGASATEVTLPRATDAGLNFRFVLSDNTANFDILQGHADDELVGSVMALSAKDTGTGLDTKIRFAAATALAGDWVEVYCDGADWIVCGQTAVNTGIVFA